MTDNPFRPFPARITNIYCETECEFTVTVEAAKEIVPGQFFQLSLPRIGEAPISVSDCGRDWIQFTIRSVGKLTSALSQLRVNDNLFLRGPYGHGFQLDMLTNRHLLIVAGGSGLAPVRPLINMICSGRLNPRSFRLIAGFKNSGGILFAEQFNQWRKHCELTLTIDKPEDGWKGETGLVTEHIRKIRTENVAELVAIVVGPPVMMKFATAECRLLGIKPENMLVSFERLMSCGLGKCGHCKIDSTYICLEGPVLNYVDAAKLID